MSRTAIGKVEKNITASKRTKRLVSIVVPVYNEVETAEKILRDIIQVMKDGRAAFEVIAVDDGSDDGSLQNVRLPNVRVIRHEKNRGYGAAVKTGIRHAQGEAVIITDADGTYPISQIPRLLDVYWEKDCDMVVGARTGEQASIPIVRRPAKWVVNKLANVLSGVRIPDLNSGLRVMKKDVLETYIRMLPDGFSLTTTITLAMLTNGFEVEYVSIDYYKRRGNSKIRPFADTLGFVQLILRTIVFFNPMKIFFPLSMVFFLLGFGFLVRDLIRLNLAQTSVFLLMSGGLILAIGLLADLITRKL